MVFVTGIEACMPILLRAVLYFIFLLYLFLGIARIAEVFASSIVTITSKKRKIRYPDPNGGENQYITIPVSVWNPTVANLTLMALGSSAPEILLSTIEIIGNRFEAGELGPGTIVGSAAYNLLIICALCIAVIKSPETRRIELYNVFIITSFFGFFAYIWLFIVLSVISKDVVDLWEAVITFLMFPLVVILAFLADKKFFASKTPDMEEQEKNLIFNTLILSYCVLKGPPEKDATGVERSFKKEELLQFLRDLHPIPGLTTEEKAQLFAAKFSDSTPRNRMQFRIEGARMLTGGKSLWVTLPEKLQEIYENSIKPQHDGFNHEPNIERKATLSRIDTDDDPNIAILEFAASSYAVLEREQRVTVDVVRYGNVSSVLRFRLDTIDGTATAGEDYVKLSEEFKMERNQQEKKITIHVIDDNQWEPDETFFVK
ncbi:unnamed protein product, partial [Didymodactylos carnosus]